MNQKVLITGAQGALGSQVVQKYLSAGYQVSGTLLKGTKVPDSASSSKVNWIEVELGDAHSVRSALGQSDFGTLVHCAGGFRFSKLDQLTDEDLEFLLSANLKSTFYLLRELLPAMKKNNFGRIVLVSAKATLGPGAGLGAYAASKVGLNMIVASLTEETKSQDITINAVLPSMIDTPANRKDMPDADFSKWVPTAELADIILSLTQPYGRSIRGALLPVSGRV